MGIDRWWEPIHKCWKVYVMPAYDLLGNNARVFLLAIFSVLVILGQILWFHPGLRDVGVLSAWVNLLFTLIPALGAWYALSAFRRRSQLYAAPALPARYSSAGEADRWRALLESDGTFRFVLWCAIGIGLWGAGNIWWLVAQLLEGDLSSQPSPWYLYDLLYIQLQIGWLLAAGELSAVITPREKTQQKGHTLLHPIGSAVAGLGHILRTSRTAFRLAFLVVMIIAVMLGLWDGRWPPGLIFSPLEFTIAVAYGLVDAVALVTVLWLFQRSQQEQLAALPSALRIGAKVIALGMGGFVILDQAIEIGFRVPETSALAFYVGSVWDLAAIGCILIMLHGLIFVVYGVFHSHPPFASLSATHRELIRALILKKSNKEIAQEQGVTPAAISQRLRKLYEVTNFNQHGGAGRGILLTDVPARDSEDDQRKRLDLADYYRQQAKDYYAEDLEPPSPFNCAVVMLNRGVLIASRIWKDPEGKEHQDTLERRADARGLLHCLDWLTEKACTRVIVWDAGDSRASSAETLFGTELQVIRLESDDRPPRRDSDTRNVQQLARQLKKGDLKIGAPAMVVPMEWRELMRYRRDLLQQYGQEQAHLCSLLGVATVTTKDHDLAWLESRVFASAGGWRHAVLSRRLAHLSYLREAIASLETEILKRISSSVVMGNGERQRDAA